MADCLQVTLKAQLKQHAAGLTPRGVIEKFKTIQMVDVHLPTTDAGQLVLSRYTQPEAEHKMLLDTLRLKFAQPAPAEDRPSTAAAQGVRRNGFVVRTFGV